MAEWAVNGTPDTLTSEADDMDITDLTARTFNQFLIHGVDPGAIVFNLTFDNNDNTDYARRISQDGDADVTSINLSFVSVQGRTDLDGFFCVYMINVSGEEKLMMSFGCEPRTSGAGTAPARTVVVGKVDTTTNSGQFTRIDCNNSGAGGYETDSNLSALGTD